jgi:hypothetical protein
VLPVRINTWPYPQTLDKAVKAYRGQTLLTQNMSGREKKVLQHCQQDRVRLQHQPSSHDLCSLSLSGNRPAGKSLAVLSVTVFKNDNKDIFLSHFKLQLSPSFCVKVLLLALQSVTESFSIIIMNLVTPKAACDRELLINKLSLKQTLVLSFSFKSDQSYKCQR